MDYHRPPPSKDVSGWTGPVLVIENKPERGQVRCRIEGRNMLCRYPDVSHTLLVLYTFLVGEIGQVNGAVQVVLDAIDRLQPKASKLFGYTNEQGLGWHLSSASRQEPRIHLALDFVIRNVLHIASAGAARIARCTPQLRTVAGYDMSTILWWYGADVDHITVHEGESSAVDLQAVIGDMCLQAVKI